jgi:hypothetical protein
VVIAAPVKATATAPHPTLVRAVRALTDHCDGAVLLDGVGWNGVDTFLGHVLAKIDAAQWTPKETYWAWYATQKYRKQLASYGIHWEEIPAPALVERPQDWYRERRERAQQERERDLQEARVDRDYQDYLRNKERQDRAKAARGRVILPLTPDTVIIGFPYDLALKERVKSYGYRRPDGSEQRVARWDGEARHWWAEVNADSAPVIIRLARDLLFEFGPGVLDGLQRLVGLTERLAVGSRAATTAFRFDGLLREPYPFQWAGIEYAVTAKQTFIADAPGLGKTLQAIAAMWHLGARFKLVICPANVKFNWRREIEMTLPGQTICVIEGLKPWPIYPEADWYIINHNITAAHLGILTQQIAIDGLIVDEGHYLSNPKVARTKAVLAIVEHTEKVNGRNQTTRLIPNVFILTGTAVLNRPKEIIPQLHILGRLRDIAKSEWQFKQLYCNPPEAPIWMGDYSFKSLGEIVEGDEVIGWEDVKSGKTRRHKLIRAKVLAVVRRESPLVKVTMESGRVFRCTPDHKWLSWWSDADRQFWVEPEPGKMLSHVIEPSVPVSPEHERLAGWLAGVYDSEGHGEFIAQHQAANPIVHAEIGRALSVLSIPHKETEKGFHITGGRKGLVDFLNKTRPHKIAPRIGAAILVTHFRKADRIVSVEPDGGGEVISMTTTTGNYVAWGYASKNCKLEKDGHGKWDDKGSSNAVQLNERMRRYCYVRREKMDVLTELPPKRRVVLDVPLRNRKEYDAAEADLVRWLADRAANERTFRAQIAHLPRAEQLEAIRARREESVGRTTAAEALVRMNALKRLAAQGKIESVKEWVADFLASGEKLVVFGWYRETVDELCKALEPLHGKPVPHIHGGDSSLARQATVDSFQRDPTTRLLVCNIIAAGEGITLTAASNVFFAEMGWNPGKQEQAEDRVHRIGQADSVTAWYMLANETIEADIYDIIAEKRIVTTAVNEGVELPEAERDMMREVAARLRKRHKASQQPLPQVAAADDTPPWD